jgi:hypothetical protein
MLQYDLTDTRFFDAESRGSLPNDAEMFAITAALLLFHDVAYTSLAERDLVFVEADIAGVAECIEYRLPVFVGDVGGGSQLRQRLRDFIGLRIGGSAIAPSREVSHPT